MKTQRCPVCGYINCSVTFLEGEKEDAGMEQVSTGKRTILVVEDYEDVRQMLRILLESDNFCVLEAASGAEALKTLKTGRPDVILMDLALPGFDGFETIRRIRKIDGFQNTPIVVLSAHSGPSVYETARRAGIEVFLTKPIDFDELAVILEQILEDGTVRNSKISRSAAQRAMINGKLAMPRAVVSEVRLTL
jgi:CheY-like chemotaxis protein